MLLLFAIICLIAAVVCATGWVVNHHACECERARANSCFEMYNREKSWRLQDENKLEKIRSIILGGEE